MVNSCEGGNKTTWYVRLDSRLTNTHIERSNSAEASPPSGDGLTQAIAGMRNMPIGCEDSVRRMQALVRGNQVRRNIRVRSIADGMVITRIANSHGVLHVAGTPAATILDHVQPGATYTSLFVRGGRRTLDVVATPDGCEPKQVPVLMKAYGPTNAGLAAFINGGYFVNERGMFAENEIELPIGHVVGDTKGKRDICPVPPLWQDAYATVTNSNGEVLLSTAPKLDPEAKFEGLRYQFFLEDQGGRVRTNPLKRFAGSLTHADHPNQRAAITADSNDVRFHTLTTFDGSRRLGATMDEWREIVNARRQHGTHLNLDGAASVSMGVVQNGRAARIASGRPAGKPQRPIPTALIASSVRREGAPDADARGALT